MLTKITIAGAAVAAALFTAAPAAKADFATMAAHNYEIVMRGVQKHDGRAYDRAPLRRVFHQLGKRGYRDFRVLRSRPGIYRIHCYRNGRPYVVRVAAYSGRILSVSRG